MALTIKARGPRRTRACAARKRGGGSSVPAHTKFREGQNVVHTRRPVRGLSSLANRHRQAWPLALNTLLSSEPRRRSEPRGMRSERCAHHSCKPVHILRCTPWGGARKSRPDRSHRRFPIHIRSIHYRRRRAPQWCRKPDGEVEPRHTNPLLQRSHPQRPRHIGCYRFAHRNHRLACKCRGTPQASPCTHQLGH